MIAFDREVARRTVWAEARGEPQQAWAAVAWTLVNRVALNPRRYGSTVAMAGLWVRQYSCWWPAKPDSPEWSDWRAAVTVDEDRSPEYGAMTTIVDAVLGGSLPDPTGGATHYWDDSISPPYWATQATRTAKIGRLQFVKDVP